MKLTLLGTGGPPPNPNRHGPAVMLEIGHEYLLFDTGRGVVSQIARTKTPLEQVNPVFLTHHHFDHISDLADVILAGWFVGRKQPLRVFGPSGTKTIIAALLDRVYEKDIEFRTKGEPEMPGWFPVEITETDAGIVEDNDRWRVHTEAVKHGHGLDLPDSFKKRWICLGYRVEAEGKVIVISGDSVACDGLDRLARDADVLVQCCWFAQAEIKTTDNENVAKHTLACADSVGRIAERARAKKLILTHFGPKPEAMMQAIAEQVARDYHGPVVLGQDLLEVEL